MRALIPLPLPLAKAPLLSRRPKSSKIRVFDSLEVLAADGGDLDGKIGVAFRNGGSAGCNAVRDSRVNEGATKAS